MTVKHKYIRHSTVGFVLWPDSIDLFHIDVARAIERRSLGEGHVESAGFAYIGPISLVCDGQSESLGIGHQPGDSVLLARQLGRVTKADQVACPPPSGSPSSLGREHDMTTFMITATGRDYFLSGADVALNQPNIQDVAHSLAQINRFTGHASRPYSVAEHSLLTADLAQHDGHSALIQMACLMHDAHECITGDQSTPSKNAIGLQWATFEHRHAETFRQAFNLRVTFQTYQAVVNHFDRVALATERRDLTGYREGVSRPWSILDTAGQEIPPASWVDLNSTERLKAPWSHWRDCFLVRFETLSRDLDAAAKALLTPHPLTLY